MGYIFFLCRYIVFPISIPLLHLLLYLICLRVSNEPTKKYYIKLFYLK